MSDPPSTRPSAAGDRNIGRIVGGRYRIVAAIGQGGMGAVYRAVHTHLGKPFAVKLLRPEISRSDEAVRRFEREADAASRLAHPSCVGVTDFGRTDDGGLFLVMELLEGESLASRLARVGRMPAADVVAIGGQILDGIDCAHGKGVVHRDLKPENILLVRDEDGAELAKILDFGIARVQPAAAAAAASSPADGARAPAVRRGPTTEAGSVFGTPEYLAPEQALGEPADARADVYAVGVMLWEMLAGRRPFEGSNRMEVLAAHLTRAPATLREAAPGAEVPPALEAVVLRALGKRRDERWQTAAEMATALRAARPGPAAARLRAEAPSEARPPGADGERARADTERSTRPLPVGEGARPAPAEVELRTPSLDAPAPAAPAVAPRSAGSPAGDGPRTPPLGVAATPPTTGGWAPAPAAIGAAPPPAARPRGGAPSLRRWGPAGVVAVALVAVVLVAALVGASRDRRRGEAGAPAAVAAVRAFARSDPAGGRARAEELAHRHPQDGRVFALLGDLLFQPPGAEPGRGLAAYREAVRLDRRAALEGTALLDNVRAHLDDPLHGGAALRLAVEAGPAAGPLLAAWAGQARDPAARRLAADAAERLGAGHLLDRVAIHGADLAQGGSCAERREAVRHLAATGDPRALDPLRQALARRAGPRGPEEPNACIESDIRAAIATFEKR